MANSALSVTLRQIQQLYKGESVASLSDGRLLERFAAAGDEASFEALVARHGPMVLGVCRSVLKDEHDTEDAFQATFLTLARNVGSVRVESSLGGWLYRVAYRVATQANIEADRRRVRERKAGMSARLVADPRRDSPWCDVFPTLHEEIDRLPERHRAPLVLCYLEGMTYEQAAQQLCWTEPTLRSRLSKARAKLKARLARRGVAGAGAILGAFFTERMSCASLPGSFVRGAVEVAMQGTTAAAGAVLLAGRVRWVLTLSTLKGALPIVVLACTASFALAFGVSGAREEGPSINPARARTNPPQAAAQPTPNPPAETVEVRGRVLDPDGKPVAAATIRLAYFMSRKPVDNEPMARSGTDGRFAFQAPRDVVEQLARGTHQFAPGLVAMAPGFGLGRVDVGDYSGVIQDVTVQLVKDDLPIEGRVLDLEGKPIADVEIHTSTLYEAPGGDLGPWIEAMKAVPSGPHNGSLREMPFHLKRTTGADGRFRLDGVGRERVVMFTISGPAITVTRTFAMTKDVPLIRSSNINIIGPKTMTFHGARFDFVAAPCKPVVGVVRDLDTGKPLAGIRVNGMEYDGSNLAYYHEVVSTTDKHGRYHLTGMSSADTYRLFLSPGEAQPYPAAEFVKSVASPGLNWAPATIDLRLKRGVLVRGRITDKVTGEPLKETNVDSLALADNPHVDDYPGFRGTYPTTAVSDADGRFAIAAVPGRGIIGVRVNSDRYLLGVGAEKFQPKGSGTALPAYPRFPLANDYNLLAPIDTEVGTEPAMLDLQVDPGRTRSVTVVDSDGKPVPRCLTYGQGPFGTWGRHPLDSATFKVTALDPRQPRLVMVLHQGRKLGGSALIQAEGNSPVTLTLQPLGILTGRLVDDEGQPRTKFEVASCGSSDSDPNHGYFHGRYTVDQDGRFRIEVVPGVFHSALAIKDDGQELGDVFRRIKLEPGQVKDLGDIRLKP